MWDSHRSLLQGDRIGFYAVYDGHGGMDAVVYTVQHLHLNIAKSSHFPTDLPKAIAEGFKSTDKNFCTKAAREVGLSFLGRY